VEDIDKQKKELFIACNEVSATLESLGIFLSSPETR
jgi:hypothetical protein